MFKLNDIVYVSNICNTSILKGQIVEIVQRSTYTKYCVTFQNETNMYYFESELHATEQAAKKCQNRTRIEDLERIICSYKADIVKFTAQIKSFLKEIAKLKKEK